MDNHPALIACALALACASVQAQLEAPQSDAAQALVMQAANAALGTQRSGARLEVQVGAPDPRLRLAPCRRVEPYLPAGHRVLGRTRVGLRCVEGAVAWNISLPVTVSLFAPGVVVRDALPAGTRLAAEHLTLAEIDWGVLTGAQSDVQAWVGRELSRPMAAGTPLQSTDLRQRQWFAAGDSVQLVAHGKGFSVGARVQAMGPGVEGRPVRVRTDNGRVLSGLAVGPNRVEVAL